MSPTRLHRLALLLPLAVALVACGSEGLPAPVAGSDAPVPSGGQGGAGTTPTSPGRTGAPTSVAGRWFGLEDYRNPGEARLVGCSAGLRPLEGLLAATTGPLCEALDPATVVQGGTEFTILRDTVFCRDGTIRGRSGGGTVNGATLQGRIDLVDETAVRTRYFTGSVDGDRLILGANRLEVIDPVSSGSCLIDPPLRIEITRIPLP